MPYQLEAQESVRDALRRTAREQVDSAIQELADGTKVDPVRAVHEARKSLKKERSLLRLGRAAFKPAQRRRENAAFRDAGRRLSDTRDADVMIQALDDLATRYAGQVPRAAFESIRERLEADRTAARRQASEHDAIERVGQDLRAVLPGVETWRLRGGGWAVVSDGLLRSYRRGRKAFKRVRSEPTVENLHEWRKRVKDLWYHLRWLRPLSPETMRGHSKEAHELSGLLGDDHDLAVLRDSLAGTDAAPPDELESVLGLIDHRREQLQTQAMFLGRRLYAENPKRFLRRVHSYWKAWRDETEAAAAQPATGLAQATGRTRPA